MNPKGERYENDSCCGRCDLRLHAGKTQNLRYCPRLWRLQRPVRVSGRQSRQGEIPAVVLLDGAGQNSFFDFVRLTEYNMPTNDMEVCYV